MSAVGSPERASAFPAGYPVGGAVMVAPAIVPAPVAKAVPVVQYTQADFERENAEFRARCGRMDLSTLWFSRVMYDKADRAVVHCGFHGNHLKVEIRDASVVEAHLAVRLLNICLLDPSCPVERNAQRVYQRVMGFLPKDSKEIDEESRAEARRRITNVASLFYGKQMMSIVDDRIGPKYARDLKITVAEANSDPAKKAAKEEAKRVAQIAVQELSKNVAGSFVDALGCQMDRMVSHLAKHHDFPPGF